MLRLRRWFLRRPTPEPGPTCRRCPSELTLCSCRGAFREQQCRSRLCGLGFTCPTHVNLWF